MSGRTIIIVGIVGSLIFVGAGLAPIFFISGEPNNWLQNIGNLGQLLSGLFAPVAFVWVVIAVVLQGRELELQREELKETRAVLALQREEMKRAADENSQQTKIMTENLKQEAARIEYDRLDTILYSAALFIFTNRASYALSTNSGGTMEVISSSLGTIDKNNSDILFARIFHTISVAHNYISRQKGFKVRFSSTEHEAVFDETLNRLKNLDDLRLSGNELIETRLNSLNFDKLTSDLELIMDRARESY